MSSWSSSYPPPPRRSRSRTPPRSGYSSGRAPHPDLYDDYRAGYDSYERDRWPYDRDRYDYGRRRSRSPPMDEPGRKRRRSMSPYDRERYDPRPRYNDDYDTHSSRHGYTSPRRHAGPHPSSRRAPPDPHHFDYPASLKQYADWFRYHYPSQAAEEDAADKQAEMEAGDGSKPRNGIKTKWEKYKKDFAATQLQTMFEHHRKSPWFAEKYDPALENLRKRVRKEGWKGRLNNFLDDLESGKFDPDLHEPEAEPKTPIKENGAGEAAEDVKPPVDEDTTFNADADEEGPDHDAARNDTNGKAASFDRRANRGEEISVPTEGNQVMIRTIPPDIGRVKLEEACSKIPGFVYLALGDPLQKRNYYRAGWLRFKEDAEMDSVMTELTEKKIEGFKLHVTHNLRPFVNKIRFAPEVASRPDRLEKDLENVKALAKVLEDQAEALRTWKKPIPPPPAKAEGDEAKAADQDAEMAPPQEPEEEDEPAPKERGSEAVERRINKVMADIKEQGLIDASDEKALATKKVVVSLDMYLAYLRSAFHTCYYCAVVTDHLEELQRKCIKHERKPMSEAALAELRAEEAAKAEKEEKEKEKEREKEKAQEDGAKEEDKEKKDGEAMDEDKEMADGTDDKAKVKENGTTNATPVKPKPMDKDARDWKRNDERWVEWLESKIALLINRDGVDPRAYGGKSYEEELSKAVEPYLKQEDEGKFRCKTCQKLFKATSFVEKHIANKHPDLVKSLEDIPYYNNFALDPHHIQPFAHPPTVVGNISQAPPPQAYGIQAPMAFQGGDFGRGGGYYGGGPFVPGGFPPYYGGPWGEYPGYPPPPGGYPPPGAHSNRRLSDRISGYADGSSIIPAGAGLPPKPTPAALDTALVSGNGPPGGRRNNRQNSTTVSGPPPPPPPDAKEDPRAAGNKRVSYHDMDLVAEGDVELMY